MRLLTFFFLAAAFFGPYLYLGYNILHFIRLLPLILLFYFAYKKVKLDRDALYLLLFFSVYFLYTFILSLFYIQTLAISDVLNFVVLYFFFLSIIFVVGYDYRGFIKVFKFFLIFFVILSAFVWQFEVRTNQHLYLSGMAINPPSHYYHLPTGFFTNANDFASIVVLSIMFINYLLYSSKKGSKWVFMLHALAFSVVYTTDSRLSFLVYLIYFIFYYRLWRVKFLIIITLFIVPTLIWLGYVGVLDFKLNLLSFDLSESSSIMRRVNLYKYGLMSAFENFSLGFGVGGYRNYYTESIGLLVLYDDVDPHNYFIEVLINSGLMIFLIFVIVHLYFFVLLLQRRSTLLLLVQYLLYHLLLMSSSSSLFLWPHYIFFIVYIYASRDESVKT